MNEDIKRLVEAARTGPYAIGSDHLPGLSKLIEESGEVGERLSEIMLARALGRTIQVAGKIIGLGHMGDHWDGSNLKRRLEEELADLAAAAAFFGMTNSLDHERMGERAGHKLELFQKWHAEQLAAFTTKGMDHG